ncbi:DNA-protecting protein DprA [Candidatus Peregrinibacteria bacterium]|nr:DNA-protecting protein DprA [Candidatus Peregrinibacteria bacterium]
MLYHIVQSAVLAKADFPPLLREVYKPPNCLYYKGDISLINKTCIAIVGTRKNTQYGAQITKDLIKDLSVLDIAIVSGLATGIDSIAHTQAIKNDIPTIAVLGCGLNHLYKRPNNDLAEEIERKGLIITEFEPEEPPLKYHFPQRNRIIAGLSIATIVVEAPMKSGALITAKYALDFGRDIFAFPGDIDRENSDGILNLLQYGGAYPVKNGKQIIEMLQKQPQLFRAPTHSTNKTTSAAFAEAPSTVPEPLALKLSPVEKLILEAISGQNGRDFDTIQQKTGLNTQELLIEISQLELKNLVTSKNGRFISLMDI